jgi:hypothetical protein
MRPAKRGAAAVSRPLGEIGAGKPFGSAASMVERWEGDGSCRTLIASHPTGGVGNCERRAGTKRLPAQCYRRHNRTPPCSCDAGRRSRHRLPGARHRGRAERDCRITSLGWKVTGVDNEPASEDSDHDPDGPEENDFKLVRRRHWVPLPFVASTRFRQDSSLSDGRLHIHDGRRQSGRIGDSGNIKLPAVAGSRELRSIKIPRRATGNGGAADMVTVC